MNHNASKRAGRLHRGDPRQIGDYTLLGRLGTGGMGVVYLGRDPAGQQVAVKMVHRALADDEEFHDRFLSEVERAQQVPPFSTAEVLDADPAHDPPYLVVEYVDGPSLGEVVQKDGPLTSANVHAVAIGVATALSAIHGAGVVHRDLKPRNVLLAPGSPKVIDFGIARAFEAASQHTVPGQMLGTLAYMAPESLDGYGSGRVGPAADIFAWGGVVTYAATGRTPFQGGNPQAMAAQILTAPPRLDGVPESLRQLVEGSLAKDAADRPTARELLDMMLATGPQQLPMVEEILAKRPGLRSVASRAQAAMRTPVGAGHSVGASGQNRAPHADHPAHAGATLGRAARGRGAHSRSGTWTGLGAWSGWSRGTAVQVSALLLLATALLVGGVATVLSAGPPHTVTPRSAPAKGAAGSELSAPATPDQERAERQVHQRAGQSVRRGSAPDHADLRGRIEPGLRHRG
jgi:eukaryotic-like serine/threonine-protein kinase